MVNFDVTQTLNIEVSIYKKKTHIMNSAASKEILHAQSFVWPPLKEIMREVAGRNDI